ncbi:ABC transporter permease [Piscirickettsia litoralis]|uniref:ABC transporter permease n=1 Tax=Piscirickettsia litoralis TaxID=1891921 RepID=UPI000A4C29C0|nr:ABC transporter permease [Piscirickettsia litoralis]
MSFSYQRFFSVLIKEFIQIRRDPVTIAMLVMIPLIQLVLFGFAINQNPRNLPTVIVSNDHSPLTREFISAIQNTKYFHIINDNSTAQHADQLLASGKTQFIVTIPTHFSEKMIRGESPEILVTADASDPSSTGNAISALNALPNQVFQNNLQGPLNYLQSKAAPFQLLIHMKYNPEQITQYNIVPGLMGVILTMSLVMVTAMAITREYEKGTMESLLATPVRPIEVMLGKITPYVLVGYLQQLIILVAAIFLFHVPNQGSILLLVFNNTPFYYC